MPGGTRGATIAAPEDDLAMPEEDRQFADAPRYASLRDYLRVLRERWILIAGCTLIAGAVAFAYSASQAKVYEASATVNANQRSADIGLIGSTAAGPPASPQQLSAELSARAERDSVAKATAKALDGPLSADQVAGKVSASIDAQSNLVLITATDQDPEFAADLANEYAEQVQREALRTERKEIGQAIELVRRQLDNTDIEVLPSEAAILEERLNRLLTLKGIARPVEVVTAATAPGAPIAPKTARNTLLGLVAGLFLGIILAFARDSLDTRLKSPREIEEQFGIPRVGQLTEIALGRTVSGQNGKRRLDPIDLEAARIMRTNLHALDPDRSVRSLAITSALPGEGKSTVAMALAWASSIAGKQTLLVECDLRRPIFAERLGINATPGITDAMLDNATPQQVLQPVDHGMVTSGNGATQGSDTWRLVCITAGTSVPDPAEILSSNRFAEFLEQASGVYDLVILDTSPLLSVVDTRELLQIVDGVLVCARSYQTTRDQARATREALAGAPTRVAGLVVTGVKLRDDDYSSYYRRYVQGVSGASS